MDKQPANTTDPDGGQSEGLKKPAREPSPSSAALDPSPATEETLTQTAERREIEEQAKTAEPAQPPQMKEQPSPTEPPTAPLAKRELDKGLGSEKANRWGVLVKAEIKRLGLIRAEESDERCYQPASYDLRLGEEYVLPRKDGQLKISHLDPDGLLTIPPFGTAIVSTYESVALPNRIVGRFNLRIDHALEGLFVQMGTQVEAEYEGPLFALLHNISDQPKSLKFRDYETRPFTIEFSYTSEPTPPAERAKKKGKGLKEFIPPNYARGGIDIVLANMAEMQKKIADISQDFNARKMMIFTGVTLFFIILTATLFIPITLSKFSYDRDYFPLVNADAIAAMKYGPNHSNNAEVAKEVIRELDSRALATAIMPREQFYGERLAQLKARRDYLKKESPQSPELKSILAQIDEIIELLKK